MEKSRTEKATKKKSTKPKAPARHKSDMLMSEDMQQDLLFHHTEQYGADEKPEDFHRKKTNS